MFNLTMIKEKSDKKHSVIKLSILFLMLSTKVHAQVTWQSFSGKENSIKDIIVTEENSGPVLWAGSHHGLTRWRANNGILSRATSYTEEHGLVNNKINCLELKVEKDSEDKEWNFIWIGTDSGISKFNGKKTQDHFGDKWKSFYQGRKVRDIRLDSVGNLWFATDTGLLMYDGANWTEYTTANSSIPSDNIFSVYTESGSGSVKVWVGTESGVVTLSENTFSELLTTETAYSIFLDGEFSWIGTNSGITRLKEGGEARGFLQEVKPLTRQILTAENGDYIFVTSQGVYTMSPTSNTPFMKYQQSGNSYQEGPGGVEWLGTDGDGVVTLSNIAIQEAKTFESLASEHVSAIASDNAGSIWLGTVDGLSRYRLSGWTRFTEEDGLASNVILDLSLSQDGELYVGTSRGLSSYDGQTWSSESALDDKSVLSVYAASNGDIWAGTLLSGVYRKSDGEWVQYTEGNEPFLVSDTITAIGEDTEGKIWAGSFHGIMAFDPSKGEWTHSLRAIDGVIDSLKVNDLAGGRKGAIWLATTEGLVKFDQRAGNSELLKPGQEDINFLSVEVSANGVILCGTSDGFYAYNGSFSEHMNTSNSPLPSNRIVAISVDKNERVWFGFGNEGEGAASYLSSALVPLFGLPGAALGIAMFPFVFFKRRMRW